MTEPSTPTRRRFLRATGTAALAAAFAGCSDATESLRQPTTTERGTDRRAVVGEVVADDRLAMVVRGTRRTDSLGEFSDAGEGNEFVVARLAVRNESDGYVDFSGGWQTRVADSEDYVYDASYERTDHPLGSGTLAPGEVMRGDTVYEVPADATGLVLQFDFAAFDLFRFDRVRVDLDSEASPIADLEQSLRVAVYEPGDRTTYGGLSVAVRGVRRETALGQFAEATPGTEYVIPDVAVTNDTSEAVTVSTLLQMALKTGTGLAYTQDLEGSAALDRGFAEGSPVGPGETRRGELAYLVDADHERLYWAFDFYDATDPQKAFWALSP
ncbi:DUF4352 domain-containing protein [Halobacterium litoreum]|uniref:DUF4352 domain-containing protein n=1 Tax=Halobacterium litoreum TaxID=2039234 RepID=A0ABD5NGS4_9EURY|nr:DUF4352 domain-containing protein [Halobacterium litoreum]UHH12686.1 DUF4352 domain-containing protein [Halobacterium litoreum]